MLTVTNLKPEFAKRLLGVGHAAEATVAAAVGASAYRTTHAP